MHSQTLCELYPRPLGFIGFHMAYYLTTLEMNSKNGDGLSLCMTWHHGTEDNYNRLLSVRLSRLPGCDFKIHPTQ